MRVDRQPHPEGGADDRVVVHTPSTFANSRLRSARIIQADGNDAATERGAATEVALALCMGNLRRGGACGFAYRACARPVVRQAVRSRDVEAGFTTSIPMLRAARSLRVRRRSKMVTG